MILSGQNDGVGFGVLMVIWLSVLGSSGLISFSKSELLSRESESSKGFFLTCFHRHWNPLSQGEFPFEISKRRSVSLYLNQHSNSSFWVWSVRGESSSEVFDGISVLEFWLFIFGRLSCVGTVSLSLELI